MEGQSHNDLEVGDSSRDCNNTLSAKAATIQEVTQPLPESALPLLESGTVPPVAPTEESVSILLSQIKIDIDPETEEGYPEMEESSVGKVHSTTPSLEMSDENSPVTATSHVVDETKPTYCPTSGAKDEVMGETIAAADDARGKTKTTFTVVALEKEQRCTPSYYMVKWITWKEKKTPIVTQSQNGPCPLLAIMNTLFLRWKAVLPAETEVVTAEDLMENLVSCVLAVTPRENAEGMELNFQQNMSDAMAVLPKLSTGLDVNIGFSGVSDFEYTPELIVFDLLDITLYHGWLLDPQSPELVSAVGKLSYNQLVEKIIDCKHSTDSKRVREALIAETFLESTATQLSYHGLRELNSSAREGEICVFFRNNHVSTMIKHQGHLYLLITDQGYLQEEHLVWESLHNVEGDGNFCDSEFRLRDPAQKETDTRTKDTLQQQIDQDYLVAMSLQQTQEVPSAPMSDLELARQLQQEEYQRQQQQGSQSP